MTKVGFVSLGCVKNLTDTEVMLRKLHDAGFEITDAQEAFRPIRFYDIGALVWFARIIEWEFPDFSVDGCLDRLLKAQKILEEQGSICGEIHRFFMVCSKG